jgi:hypothetical protein
MRVWKFLLLGVCCLTGTSCHRGLDLGAVRGGWQNGRDEIEFSPTGGIRFSTSKGVLPGTYVLASRAEIRVDLGQLWPSGERRYWRAMVQGDQLGLCEIHNGRHCMRFARPGHRVRALPR